MLRRLSLTTTVFVPIVFSFFVLLYWNTNNSSEASAMPVFSTEQLSTRLHYRDMGVRLEVPSLGTQAVITPEQAASKVQQLRTIPMSAKTTVNLASYSNDVVGSESDSGERMTPLRQNILAWIVTVPDTPMVLHAPPPFQEGTETPQPSNAPPAPEPLVPMVYVIDAQTGKLLEAFQTPEQPVQT